jgi:hypothetical protein
MKTPISNARIAGAPIFSNIARENHGHILALETQIEKARKKDEETSENLETTPAKHSLVTVVFAVIAIEAYIYDYAARHFSDAFVSDHIDKLDLSSKWIIVPKLITGRELPTGRKWFELLKNMIGARNLIAHHKSLALPGAGSFEIQVQKVKDREGKIYRAARQSVRLFDLLVEEISEIDPAEKSWIQVHLSKNIFTPEEK